MAKFVEEMNKAMVAAFESEDYANRREETVKQFEDQKSELMKELNQKALEADFALQRSQIGTLIIPVINGQLINEQQFAILPQKIKDEIGANRKRLQEDLTSAFRQFREIDREAEAAVDSFNKEVANYAMEHLL